MLDTWYCWYLDREQTEQLHWYATMQGYSFSSLMSLNTETITLCLLRRYQAKRKISLVLHVPSIDGLATVLGRMEKVCTHPSNPLTFFIS